MNRFVILSLLILSSVFQQLLAQVQGNRWNEIEKAIKENSNLRTLRREVDSLRYQAERSGDAIEQARCFYYRMLIQDRKTEDSLYFRNSAFIDSILLSRKGPDKLKSLMYLLKGKRLISFKFRYLKFSRDKYRTPDLPCNYAALGNKQTDSVIKASLAEALKAKGKKFVENRDLLWLTSTPDVFLFDPSISDIVHTELLDYSIRAGRSTRLEVEVIASVLALPSSEFLNALKALSAKNQEIAEYLKWINESKQHKDKAAFIETLLRKYLFVNYKEDSTIRASYLKYLKQILSSPVDMVRAHAIYQQCLLLYQDGGMYQYGRDVKSQYAFREALNLYQENKDLVNRFQIFSGVLAGLEQSLKATKLEVKADAYQMVNEPLLLRVNYKNLSKIYYHIVDSRIFNLNELKTWSSRTPLFNLPTVTVDSISLPDPADYNDHSVYVKHKGLPAGEYHLIFSTNKEGRRNDWETSYIILSVTDLVALNTDKRLFVLNRKTGRPVAGAQIKGYYGDFKNWKKLPLGVLKQKFSTSSNGYVDIDEDKINNIEISFRGDTLRERFRVEDSELPEEVYNKDDYDDLLDYHDEQIKMYVFTDRSIYRPGQTVYYNALILSRNPHTGELIVFNKRNVKDAVFNNVYKKWLNENQPVLYLKDAMQRKTDSVKLKPDAFGSFSGSFKIPSAATPGNWSIESDDIEGNYRNGDFRVEEYKRPTFEITLEKPNKLLLPGDAFSLRFKVKSFSGASLNNLSFSYLIQRSGYMPDGSNSKKRVYRTDTLANLKILTDERGEAVVDVTDTLLRKLSLDNETLYSYTYAISVEVKDATGESVELDERLYVSNRPIRIKVQSPGIVNRQNAEPIAITTSSDFVANPAKAVRLKIYKVLQEATTYYYSFVPDQWIYPKEELIKAFPYIDFREAVQKEQKILVDDITLNTGEFEKLKLDTAKIKSGFYVLEAEVRDNEMIRGSTSAKFKVFDSFNKTFPQRDKEFLYSKEDVVNEGQNVKVFTGSLVPAFVIYHLHYAINTGSGVQFKHEYFYKEEQAGLNEFEFKVPGKAVDQVLLTKIKVGNNRGEELEKRLQIFKQEKVNPEIIIETYRKVLSPGEKRAFTVSVKTKNKNTVAQLMSTMYDASLDKLEKHQWEFPDESRRRKINLSTDWSLAIEGTTAEQLAAGPDLSFNYFNKIGLEGALQGRLPGISIGMDDSHLNEVVVGYGTTTRMATTASVTTIQIRGLSSLVNYKQPLIIVDGQIYAGDFSALNPACVNQLLVLKGADASAIYGARAAEGVLIISTKGQIVLPQPVAPEPIVKIRKNFNETAFFYPKIYADRKGFYTLSFTMPEIATEWNWKMLAHTKDARSAYAERKLNTQLNLMIQPHMPRLLYQGDKINLMSRISNMDTLDIKGTISCSIEDAVTGQDITAELLKENTHSFSAAKKQSVASGFWLSVPPTQINPLKVIIRAATLSIADAEEHIIPVYSTRVFVNKVETVDLKAKENYLLKRISLHGDAEFQGLGLSLKPLPQSALLHSLSWLSNYSYDCAEQTFNKLYAHVTALNIIRNDKTVQTMYSRAKTDSIAVRSQEIDQMELPWLKLDAKNEQQQKQLYKLLDSVNTKRKIEGFLQRLYKLQNPDGGIAWFDGGLSNSYISTYILGGLGKLEKEGWKPGVSLLPRHNSFISSLLTYTSPKRPSNAAMDIFTIYSLSGWLNKLPDSLLSVLKADLAKHWKEVNSRPLSEQALLITATLRLTNKSDELKRRAKEQLQSIRQSAIEDGANGIRWKAIADNESLNFSAEETVAVLSEAFKEEGTDKTVSPGILKWLLNTRSDDSWRTTKGTAAVINLLKEEKGTVTDLPATLSLRSGTKTVQVTNSILSGSPYTFIKTDLQTEPVVSNPTDSTVKAFINYYYFTAAGNLDSLNKQVKLSKKMFVSNGKDEWMPLADGRFLKSGEKVKVELSVIADKPLKFVCIDDKRPAAFEPLDARSEYKFQKRLYYYCSVRDTGLQLFAESIPSGTSVISYELKVSQEGTFFGGPAVLQCMYRPEIVAYSNGISVVCDK